MSIVNMRVRCSDTFSEVLAGNAELTELIIEDIVSTALLQIFDAVDVENVTVQEFPEDVDGNREHLV
jgi:hypothetical protein